MGGEGGTDMGTERKIRPHIGRRGDRGSRRQGNWEEGRKCGEKAESGEGSKAGTWDLGGEGEVGRPPLELDTCCFTCQQRHCFFRVDSQNAMELCSCVKVLDFRNLLYTLRSGGLFVVEFV